MGVKLRVMAPPFVVAPPAGACVRTRLHPSVEDATSTRDGRLRAALSQLLRVAGAAGCQAVVIENLNFEAARTEGTDHHGRRQSRGRQGPPAGW